MKRIMRIKIKRNMKRNEKRKINAYITIESSYVMIMVIIVLLNIITFSFYLADVLIAKSDVKYMLDEKIKLDFSSYKNIIMPEEMSEDEIEEIVDDIFDELESDMLISEVECVDFTRDNQGYKLKCTIKYTYPVLKIEKRNDIVVERDITNVPIFVLRAKVLSDIALNGR